MKGIPMNRILPVSVLALLTSFCLGADTPPSSIPVEDATEPAPLQPDRVVNQALQKSKEVVAQALDQANRATQKAWKGAEKVYKEALQTYQDHQLTGPKLALNEDSDEYSVAVGEAGDAAPMVVDRLIGASGRAGGQPLVVRTSDLEPSTLANIQEDLAVMSRILTKTVERESGREGHDAAMGIYLLTLPGSRHPQSIYLEGYGVLFLVNVKFPLTPPATKESEKAEPAPDSTWEKTKQELYGPRVVGGRVWDANPAAETVAEYSAEKVDSLKKDLLEALKSASNIRNVKPDESITIAVAGVRQGTSSARIKRVVRGDSGTVRKGDIFWSTTTDGVRLGNGETMLTMRAKKADIDAFAKGTIKEDEFRKRVSMTAY
jgi:hypothetical protein